MIDPASRPSGSTPTAAGALRAFPAEIQDAYQRYATQGDLNAADTVVLAIVMDQIKHPSVKRTPGPAGDHSSLIGDLGLDSVSILDAVFTIEGVFCVQIPDTDLPGLATIGDLRTYLRRRLSPPSAT